MRADNFWVAAAERESAGRLIVRGGEKLTAFLELESPLIRTPRNVGRGPT